MRKIIISVLIVFTLILFTACTKNETKNNVSVSNDNKVEINDDLGDDYILSDDDQPFYVSRSDMMAFNGEGSYCFLNDCLYYTQNKNTVPVCNKPDCGHITNVDDGKSECNAFFSNERYYYEKGFSYYKDSIYLLGLSRECDLGSKSDLTVSIYKVSKDGSNHREICKLFKTSDINSVGEFAVHRGYAFWTAINSKGNFCIYKLNINSPQYKTEIFRCEDNTGFISRFACVGNYMYFSYSYSENEDYENYKGEIYRLNINTDKKEKLIDTNSCFTVFNNKIYYFKDRDINAYDLKSGKIFPICQNKDKSAIVVSDHNYIYYTNWDNGIAEPEDYVLHIIDEEGKVINDVNIPDCEYFVGSDGRRLYMETHNREVLGADISQINSNVKWETVFTISDDGEINIG